MGKTDRLIAAAIAAASLAIESACSDGTHAHPTSQITCTTIDPRTHKTSEKTVAADATCPPVSAMPTSAHGAGGGGAGWYYYGNQPYYGTLRKGGRTATPEQAQMLEAQLRSREATIEQAEHDEISSARAFESRGGGVEFGDSGAHGGFGG